MEFIFHFLFISKFSNKPYIKNSYIKKLLFLKKEILTNNFHGNGFALHRPLLACNPVGGFTHVLPLVIIGDISDEEVGFGAANVNSLLSSGQFL